MSTRWAVWLIINLGLILACCAYSAVTPSFDSTGVPRVLLGITIGILGLGSVFIFPKTSKKTALFLILAVSLLPRLALLPTAPSDDVNRYLWEGKLTALGVDPYQAIADAEVFKPYEDEYWALMNHRDRPTAYPPLSMHAFRLINLLGYSPMSYKVVALVLDMLLIATLLALLRHHLLPQRWVLFYALSPLSLFSYAAEGHFDILMVLALGVAMLAHSKRWWAICGASVAVAVGVKIMAAVVAPLLLWRSGKRGWSVAAVVLMLPIVFYWQSIGSVMNALFLFGSGGSFNGPVHQLLSKMLSGGVPMANLVVAGLYTVCWFFAFWLMLKGRLWSSLLVALGSLVVLSPIVHFWYLTWALPILAVRPKFSWLTLSVTSSLYFLVWHSAATGKGWALPLWAHALFWIPFFVLLLLENKNLFAKVKKIHRGDSLGERSNCSVVIPTYNAGSHLKQALDNLSAQNLPPREVVIADAGSSDGSLDDLGSRSFNVRILQTEQGRGGQIKAGVEAASGDWVVVLHSDVIIPTDALENLVDALEKNPHVVGGALGQRFSNQSAGLLLIEVMNEFRAVLLSTSFGDQTQFFHRETALSGGVLTDQPLMEDVEMSDRLGGLGDLIYLGKEAEVSARKWTKHSFWKRFFTIIEFCLRYRLLSYSREKRAALSHSFYERYYKN